MMQMRRPRFGYNLIILVCLLLLSTNCSEQRPAPVEMNWCLSDTGSIINSGFELRDGRVIGVNLARIKEETVSEKLLTLPDLKYLRLTTQAYHVLGAKAISDHLPKLNELCIRLEPQSDAEKDTVTFAEYQRLLTLPRLKKLTVEILQMTEGGNSLPVTPVSPILQLDVAVNLQSRLFPVLDGLQLKHLRLQLTRDSRPLSVDDLKEINRQVNLESFTFFGPTLITFPGQSRVEPARIDFSRLNGLNQLQELSLCNVQFDPAGLLHLPRLKQITIRECQLETSSFAALLQHPSLEKVVVLGCSNEDLRISQRLPPVDSKLKQIDLEMVTLPELKMFANLNCDLRVTLGSMNSDRYLERFYCAIGDSVQQVGVPEVQQLGQLKTMSELTLVNRLPGTIDCGTMLSLAALPKLRSLSMNRANLKQTKGPLPRLKANSQLQHLSLLTYPGPAPEMLNQLLPPELLSLSLRASLYAEQHPVDPWKILTVPPLSQLQKLELSDFQFLRDKSRIPVQFLPRSLRQITFEFCDLDADCLDYISKQSPQLKEFRITGLSSVSKDDDLLMLNRFSQLERVDLFDSHISANVAYQVNASHVRIGGAEMFKW
ncbi:hypothetical protein [Gimesia algae]|uniref:Leucine Rich repeats (2 copies) n=1 Tax=Gimesia algae TaxID=2527971 RepID=A0A517VDD0_9PLAN|nr:hypothetical protein [Gimesia algae]QDT91011.1 hypothetical protein Pan161_26650 [Gimesia algae]